MGLARVVDWVEKSGSCLCDSTRSRERVPRVAHRFLFQSSSHPSMSPVSQSVVPSIFPGESHLSQSFRGFSSFFHSGRMSAPSGASSNSSRERVSERASSYQPTDRKDARPHGRWFSQQSRVSQLTLAGGTSSLHSWNTEAPEQIDSSSRVESSRVDSTRADPNYTVSGGTKTDKLSLVTSKDLVVPTSSR